MKCDASVCIGVPRTASCIGIGHKGKDHLTGIKVGV